MFTKINSMRVSSIASRIKKNFFIFLPKIKIKLKSKIRVILESNEKRNEFTTNVLSQEMSQWVNPPPCII